MNSGWPRRKRRDIGTVATCVTRMGSSFALRTIALA
jgi:hypothetical protein